MHKAFLHYPLRIVVSCQVFMKSKDIIIMYAVGGLAKEAISQNLMTKEEYRELFKGINLENLGEQYHMTDEKMVKEIKNILKSYTNKIRKEENKNE